MFWLFATVTGGWALTFIRGHVYIPGDAMATADAIAANVMTFRLAIVLARSWPYTTLLMQVARGGGPDVGQHALMAETFILGAVAGGVALHRFELHLGHARDWLRALLGGAIMGAGAVLVPGGNDAMLLVGVPLALPNLVAAYVAMSLVLVGLTVWRVRMRRVRTA